MVEPANVIYMFRLSVIASFMVLAGCSASPLFVERSQLRGTYAEVPRDARGEPLWAAIGPMPEGAVAVARRPERSKDALASFNR